MPPRGSGPAGRGANPKVGDATRADPERLGGGGRGPGRRGVVRRVDRRASRQCRPRERHRRGGARARSDPARPAQAGFGLQRVAAGRPDARAQGTARQADADQLLGDLVRALSRGDAGDGAPVSQASRARLRAAGRVGRYRRGAGQAVPRKVSSHVPGRARRADGSRQHLRRARAARELPHRPQRVPDRAGARSSGLGQPRGARAGRGDAGTMTGESLGVAVAFTAGLFSFLSPCVLPLFPSYVSFITGMSVSDLTADLSPAARRRVLIHAVAFVLGFSLDFRDWIRRIGGVLIVIFGLYIAGLLKIGIFGRTQQWQLREKPAGYLGSLAVGITFAIGWTPCVGPILGAILSLAGTAETVQRGIGLLVAYSAGLGLPFLISAAALGPFLAFFRRYRRFIPVVERAAGVVLVIVGVLVFTNYYVVLNSWAVSLTPDWLLKRL